MQQRLVQQAPHINVQHGHDFGPSPPHNIALRSSFTEAITGGQRIDGSIQDLEPQHTPHSATNADSTSSCNTKPEYLLSTGETLTHLQITRRTHLAGFPRISEPLPRNIEDQEIIERWPNHLWGPLLIGISKKWTPKEMADLCEHILSPNRITKRIKAAKVIAGEGITDGRKRKRDVADLPHSVGSNASGAPPGRMSRKRKRKVGTVRNIEDSISDKKSSAVNNESRHSPKGDLGVESEASRAFREEQEEILEAVRRKDPSYEKRQMKDMRRMPQRDRIVINQVVKERQHRVGLQNAREILQID